MMLLALEVLKILLIDLGRAIIEQFVIHGKKAKARAKKRKGEP